MLFPWHEYVDMFAGDDWAIGGLLLDQDDQPCDLTGASIGWILVDPNGAAVIGANTGYTINILDPATDGKIIVSVPRTETAQLSAGRYTDGIRMAGANGKVSTMWEGHIGVNVTPFGALTIEPLQVSSKIRPAGVLLEAVLADLAAVQCRFGCASPAVGIYYAAQGCACYADPVQALCAQHALSMQSTGPIIRVVDFRQYRVLT